ncbi:MAG: ABC transporter ATP-binding protein [Burkholderiaceae bacterium]|nr:ABC transporter ATP-binding protein [Burkholderiaceae bacterium]
MLETEALTLRFGGLTVLRDVGLRVAGGEILGLIGPNGAGKSTLLSLISGALSPSRGRVIFQGADVTGLRPHQLARRGVARVLQTPRCFPGMSIRDNVAVGALFGGRDRSQARGAVRLDPDFLLELMGLSDRSDEAPEDLTLQEKRMLEIARALAMHPRLLLLDEAMSGLNPAEMQEAMALIRRIRDELGVAIIWVEHVIKAIMGVAERVLVLNFGQVIGVGTPAEITANQAVIDAYLGVGE